MTDPHPPVAWERSLDAAEDLRAEVRGACQDKEGAETAGGVNRCKRWHHISQKRVKLVHYA